MTRATWLLAGGYTAVVLLVLLLGGEAAAGKVWFGTWIVLAGISWLNAYLLKRAIEARLPEVIAEHNVGRYSWFTWNAYKLRSAAGDERVTADHELAQRVSDSRALGWGIVIGAVLGLFVIMTPGLMVLFRAR